MRMINVFHLLITMAVLSAACNTSHEPGDKEKEEIAQQIRERMKGYHDAINRKDIEWLKGYWSKEADFAVAIDGLYTTDYDSVIVKDYSDWFVILKDMPELKWIDSKVTVLSKELASVCTPFTWYARMNKGDTLRCKGAFLFLFRKTGKDWKVIQAGGTHIYN